MIYIAAGYKTDKGARYGFHPEVIDLYPIRKCLPIPMVFVPTVYKWAYLSRLVIIIL